MVCQISTREQNISQTYLCSEQGIDKLLWHWETKGELDDKYFNKIVKEHVFPWLDVQQLVEYLGLRGIDCPESNSTET